jgi:hypothetical protein
MATHGLKLPGFNPNALKKFPGSISGRHLSFRPDEARCRWEIIGGLMRRIIAIGILALFGAGSSNVRAALLYPFLEPVQTLVVSNIAGVTNRAELSREERQQFRALVQARNTLDRRARTGLVNDVQVLASLSTLLPRAFPDGEFDLLLSDALLQYRDVLAFNALTLETNINLLPESPTARAAASTLENTLSLLEQVDPTDLSNAGIRPLVTSALRLRSVEAAIGRLTRDDPGTAEFSARVNGELLRSVGSGVSVTYNPAAEFITITGRELSGVPTVSRTITLFVDGVGPGSTSRFLGTPASGSYATYSEQGNTNSATYTSVSGHVVIKVDERTGEVSGRFSFDGISALDRSQVARVNGGSFSIRTE